MAHPIAADQNKIVNKLEKKKILCYLCNLGTLWHPGSTNRVSSLSAAESSVDPNNH